VKRLLLLALVCSGTAPARAGDAIALPDTYRGLRTLDEVAPLFWKSWVHQTVSLVARGCYTELIKQAEAKGNLDATELWAVGECHAVLGAANKAAASYRLSLRQQDNADARLGLARVLLATDPAEADRQFEKAVALQPDHVELGTYHLLAAQAWQSRRDWAEAARRLERYLDHLRPQRDRDSTNRYLAERCDQAGLQLDRLRRFVALVGQAPPELKARAAIQGEKVELASLRGRVVVVDFWGAWSLPSRRRMDLLQRLAARHGDKDLAVVGCTQLVRQAYRAEDDRMRHDPALTPARERAGLAGFAARHNVKYPLFVVGPATLEEFGVLSLPHTVVLDRQGNIRLIFLGMEAAKEKDLETGVEELVNAR
jgi:tetratricopeptide (TPR) repeat protein